MGPWLQASIFGLTLFFMLVGLVGLIVPLFPGMLVMWLAALGYGVVVGFDTLGVILFVLITLGMLVGVTIDNVMMGAGARKGGASWVSIILGLIAGVVGTFVFPPVGGLIAAPLVILLLEYLRSRDVEKAWTATRGLAVGWGLSFLVRFGIGLVMIALWLVWAFAR
jgi:uncharacterized protein YqgC (DUF456 family)